MVLGDCKGEGRLCLVREQGCWEGPWCCAALAVVRAAFVEGDALPSFAAHFFFRQGDLRVVKNTVMLRLIVGARTVKMASIQTAHSVLLPLLLGLLPRSALYHVTPVRSCALLSTADEHNLKALYRRGQARAGWAQWLDAAADLERALKLAKDIDQGQVGC